MSVTRRIRTIASALAVILGSSTAYGDGVCEKGYRDTTPAERATMTSVLETAKKALPAAPQGWVIGGDETFSVPTSICGDFEAHPWGYSFTRHYRPVGGVGLVALFALDPEFRNKIIEKAGMKEKQPRLDAALARVPELQKEWGAAVQKGDYTKAEEIQKEIVKANMEYLAIIAEGGGTERFSAAFADVPSDLDMTIVVAVNPNRESAAGEAQSFPVPQGAQSASRWSDTGGEAKNDHALILLGTWKPNPEGGAEPVRPADAVGPAARSMSVRVTADSGRLAAMVESIDFKNLATLLAP